MVLEWLIKLTLSWLSADLRYRAISPAVINATSPERVQIVGQFSIETRICLFLGNSGFKFGCFAHRARWNRSRFGAGKRDKETKIFFSDSVIASTNLLSVPLGPWMVHRKAVLFSVVLKINLLLNFFKYLLLWVAGRDFFPSQFCLGEETFLCSL